MISINVQNHDVVKHKSISLLGDAKVSVKLILERINNFHISKQYETEINRLKNLWEADVVRVTSFIKDIFSSFICLLSSLNGSTK